MPRYHLVPVAVLVALAGCAPTSDPSAPVASYGPSSKSIGGEGAADLREDGMELVIIAPGERALEQAEARWGTSTSMLSIYNDFTQPFPYEDLAYARSRGLPVMISWEPWKQGPEEQDQPAYSLATLINSEHDDYLRDWLTAARDTRQPLLVRFAPEMNGDWRPWSTGVNGNTPGQYVAAWRHVHDMAQQVGADNIEWVWNPAITYEGDTAYAELYPGDAYVDSVALDGYNWGSTREWGWQSYDDIFAPSVALLRQVAPGKPWGIAETASAPGKGKTRWFEDTAREAAADGASYLAWFEYDKETDWRLGQSAGNAVDALQADGTLAP